MSAVLVGPLEAVVLRKAADLIDERGWLQGQNFDADGRCCAFWALGKAAGKQRGLRPIYDQFAGYLHARNPRWREVSSWNDAPGRTKEQVVAALRECADLLAERHDLSTAGVSAVDDWVDLPAGVSRQAWLDERLAELDAALGGAR